MQARLLRFGPFEVDLKAGELRRHGRRLRLQEKPFQVLQALLEREGDLISREELRERLWAADTFVDFDNGLNNAVRKVRRVLSDSAAHPKYVETVGRRGYRFIGPIERMAPAAPRVSGATGWAPTAGFGSVSSLAVLPLVNLSNDRDEDYFSDGMTDALIGQIARIRALRVIASQSTRRYQGSRAPISKIARELGVDAIVQGTVLRSGDRVRITVQLVHGANDSYIWSGQWERSLADVLILQSEIARDVAREVQAALTADETGRFEGIGSVDPAAYDTYLRGRFFWNQRTRESLLRSIEYYERAIAMAPRFAAAHAAIAESLGPLGYLGFVSPDRSTPAMRAAATRALAIDPELVEGLTALGACAAFHEWRWAEGEQNFQRAIAINPNYSTAFLWFGLLFENTGRQAENVAARRRALELDPFNLRAWAALGYALFLNGQCEEAVARLEGALELDPHWFFARRDLALVDVSRGRLDEAIAKFRSINEYGSLGHALARAGREDEAREALAALQSRAATEYVSPYQAALIEIGLGESDSALRSLQRAFDIRAIDLSGVKVDPRFAPLAADSRFAALLRRMNLD
ncbi:MAG TPA: winged helix-turn-helix domain-containing protein [Vicinamibacterales bacterium]|nr:winged helix-turn-helix domain-containing protein [Vicinamibacterales bacterium]